MSERLDRSNALTDYGLTPLEAKVYVGLIEHGKLSANQIAKTMRIARPEVYRIVRELVKKGCVTEHFGRPMLFEAIPPDEMLERLTEQFQEKIDTLRQKQQELSDWLTSKMGKQEGEPTLGRFQIVRNPKIRWAKLSEMFSSANEEVLFVSSGLQILQGLKVGLEEEAFKAAGRGVRVRGITDVDQSNHSNLLPLIRKLQEINSLNEVRYSKQIAFNYVIRDGEELFFNAGIGDIEDESWEMQTDSPIVVNAMISLFEHLWHYLGGDTALRNPNVFAERLKAIFKEESAETIMKHIQNTLEKSQKNFLQTD